jgi:FkbM family methyltransferase
MDLNRAFELVVLNGTCVFDVGSFKGEVAGKLAVLVGKCGSVCAFEPHPIHYFELSVLAEALSSQHGLKIFPYCKAIGENMGHVTFHLSTEVGNPKYNQASSIVTELANAERLGQMLHILVELDTLDEFCRKHFIFPSFIKVDTEGADSAVIMGGAKMIKQCQPAIIIEFPYSPNQPIPMTNIEHLRLLENLGYELFVVDVMWFREVWTTAGSPYLSDLIFPFSTNDLANIPGDFLGDVLALPRNNASFAASAIRKFVAKVSLLQFLSNPYGANPSQ